MKTTLLWIEDDPNDILLGERALRQSGFPAPVILRDGEEAIGYLGGKGDYEDRIRFPLPSLILTDLKLPRMSGLEVLRWMREQEGLRRIPVIILTSSRQKRDIEKAYDFGANAYLVKPIKTQVLAELFQCLYSFWVLHNTTCDVSLKSPA